MRKLFPAFAITCLLAACASDANKALDATLTPQVIESPVDSASAEPYLFTDKNGIVYLSWMAKDGATSKLMYASRKDTTWGEPVTIASGNDWFVNWADYPVIATDGEGNFIAHFLQKSDSGKFTYDIKLSTSNDKGITWSQPFILHDDGKKAEHGFVSIIPYGENYFVTWLDGRNAAMEDDAGHHGGHHGEMTLRAAMIDKSGKKVNEWELDNRVCDCCQTSAAITGNGPVVVYRDRSDSEIRDISIVRLVNGEWTKPQPVFPDNWKIEGCPVNGPRIAAIGNNVAVAWFTSVDNNPQVNLSFSVDGGAAFTTPMKMNDDKSIGRVDLEWINKRSVLVSWMEGANIKAAKVYSDGRKYPSFTVASSSESRSSGFPQMTKADDSMIFAWTDDKAKTIRMASINTGRDFSSAIKK